jgi:hypothetical protein
LPRVSRQRVNQILRMHAENGGEIRQCLETRPEWRRTSKYHYDFVIKIGGRGRYVECRLIEDAPDRPELFVVSFHNAS